MSPQALATWVAEQGQDQDCHLQLLTGNAACNPALSSLACPRINCLDLSEPSSAALIHRHVTMAGGCSRAPGMGTLLTGTGTTQEAREADTPLAWWEQSLLARREEEI